MQYTSAEANKLLKKLNEERNALIAEETQRSVFRAAIEENVDDVRPEYDYEQYKKALEEIEYKIRTVKHEINLFNSTTVVFDNMTIDEVLVYIPQLSARKQKLERMALRLPKTRVDNGYVKSNHIEYDYANYDVEFVKKELRLVTDYLSFVQTALDKVNNTVEFDVNF